MTVEVTNDSHADVVVYVTRSGVRFRLGMVAGLEVKTFVVPSGAVHRTGSIRLVADPIGITAPFVTEPIPVALAAEIAFHVKKRINHSYYAIRGR